MDLNTVKTDISALKTFWYQRNKKFLEWYEILVLTDILASKGMETYVSNEPQTFYNMAHYLVTKGKLSHTAPIANESGIELEKRAKLNRSCESLWTSINRERKLGGNASFVEELAFFSLVLGWYSVAEQYNSETGLLDSCIWNPYEVYPDYTNGRMSACLHSYSLTEQEAKEKADNNGWIYPSRISNPMYTVTLDDYFLQDKYGLHNLILINGEPVTNWIDRPDMQLLVSPVGGFPDKGILTPNKKDWRRLAGRGIFEVNQAVSNSFNKWKSVVSQILRDTAQPITQEFSSTPQATPEQLRERGAFFHYAPGEKGLERVATSAIPIEVQSHLANMLRELQKGSFNDAVYGMMEGQSGYALSLLASSSANQILYPYMDAKHFVISESDKFWLSNLKRDNKTYTIKGNMIEKLEPKDIPEDIDIQVSSSVATPKDWMERGTIANMLDKHLDQDTILSTIYEVDDIPSIKRRKSLDRVLNHPMSIQVELIAGYYKYAEYLQKIGDRKQAALFIRAAKSLESQLGAPAPGQANPADMTKVQSQRDAGAPTERVKIDPSVSPPEEAGFSPQMLRKSIGRGSVKAIRGVK